ncbi:MAG: hypothetical protein IJU25_06510 [Lachnospiraceae bacterium]|nr:hypothetical protein [Lachnospiraceae bacterium]
MTSKTLWNNLLKIEGKQRIWVFAVSFLVLLFMPISLLMMIDAMELNGYMMPQAMVDNIVMYFENGGYGANGVMTMLIGFVTAFFGFFFVYSKPAVDLYHSLPVRREKLYLAKYIIGIVPGILLQLLADGLAFAILATKGYLTSEITAAFLFTCLVNLIAFLIAYNVAIIAIMLTGTLVVGILGGITLMGYVSFATMLIESYCSACFQTYWDLSFTKSIWYMLLNPMKIVMMQRTDDHLALRFVLLTLEALVLGCIGLILYEKRPSESTSKSLCHNISKHVIRIPLVIAAALAGGVYVSFMFNSLPAIWYWAAFVIVGVLAHVVLELIFEQEIRGIWRHPVQLLASLAVAAFLSLIFQYDLFGYDRYLPKEADIRSLSVRLNGIEGEIGHIEADEKHGSYTYSDYTDLLDEVDVADHAAVLELAKGGIASLNPERSAIARRQESMRSAEVPEKEPLYFLVRYTLKSGREVYRSYQADFDGLYDATARIYEDKAYRDYLYQVDEFIEDDAIRILSARTWDDNQAFDNMEIDVKAFLKAYEKDLENRKLADLADFPLLRLSSYDPVSYYDLLNGYYVYANDTNTMNYLKSAGFDAADFGWDLDPAQITSITVHDYGMFSEEPIETYGEYAKSTMDFSYGGNEESVQYVWPEDAEKITELVKIMIPQTFAYNNDVLHPTRNQVDLEVTYSTEMNSGLITYFLLPYGAEY